MSRLLLLHGIEDRFVADQGLVGGHRSAAVTLTPPRPVRAPEPAPFAPPALRREWTPRARLVSRLQTEPDLPISVLASAGYGKTTLLAQWVSADPCPAAWLRLSALHNDVTQLSSDLALAIRSVSAESAPKSLVE